MVSASTDQSKGQADEVLLHGSCVADAGRAVFIRGASGRGKSSLSLQLMAYGAMLVADDQTLVRQAGDGLWVRAPDTTRGLVEARGVGILRAETELQARLQLVVDLDQIEMDRLPHPREAHILGKPVPLLWGVDAPYFAAAILQMLRHGRNA
ncbi:HPr kinase/phosphatase C-terminal domain-containing protein [Shimia sp. R10_1]|uniref:HPr kinase/phosphorylase n=1 Tax=Shimia sp. R10_1 TaxID=2821095 RepID=UPI001ADD34CF|nr:HPr kinase/phosphatase C-terminal domain-containing protein [Shimia sp. R10_1]MBO9475531.1 HPr kinase/phosphatase C-terminal domain-containing protein [Shimia sp. R10_1]